MKRKTLQERFELKFNKGTEDECWEWLAARTHFGHGKIMVCPETKSFAPAHRVAYSLYVGTIPEGMVVRHKCDNPGCVNPKHLVVGTQKDNARDALYRGRLQNRVVGTGENHGHAKFTDEEVNEMRVFRAQGKTTVEIAEIFGATQSYVSKVCRGESRNSPLKGQSSFVRNRRSQQVGDARRKVTPEMKSKILELFSNGKTHQQIADAVGLTQGHVSVVLQKLNGGKKQKPRLSEETISNILRLREQGLSFAKIGEAVGVPKPTVQSVLKRKVGN